MIVKLVNVHNHAQYIEADVILQQPLANGSVDLECTKRGNEQERMTRFIISEDMEGDGYWKRAYIMEGGKTIDTIRGSRPPCEGKSFSSGEGKDCKVKFELRPVQVR